MKDETEILITGDHSCQNYFTGLLKGNLRYTIIHTMQMKAPF